MSQIKKVTTKDDITSRTNLTHYLTSQYLEDYKLNSDQKTSEKTIELGIKILQKLLNAHKNKSFESYDTDLVDLDKQIQMIDMNWHEITHERR